MNNYEITKLLRPGRLFNWGDNNRSKIKSLKISKTMIKIETEEGHFLNMNRIAFEICSKQFSTNIESKDDESLSGQEDLQTGNESECAK